MDKIYKLQNGTDIRGVAFENDVREVNLRVEEVREIAKAFYIWLKNKTCKEDISVAVGCDSRITGEDFKKVIIDTIVECGVSVLDCKMATTPAMFMSTILDGYKSDGAIMITASHLPFYYNGMKFFTNEGGLEKKDIKELLDISIKEIKIKKTLEGRVVERNLIDDYSQMLVEKIRSKANIEDNYNYPLEGLHIIVDAGNGAGGFFATKVLKELGAKVDGSQFLEPDGMFPNHIPNPENKEAMNSICNSVIANKCDLGIIFDTDVDRAAVVGKNGEPINKNSLIALLSAIVLEENPNTYIVTDSITSNGLTKFINSINGKHHRFKRGYKNVINEAIRLNQEGNDCNLAIETSGHGALKENYFLDDGAYIVAKILVKLAQLNKEGKMIHELITDLEKPQEEKELRIKIEADNHKLYAEELIGRLRDFVRDTSGWKEVSENYEGMKVNCTERNEDGWFLIRTSLHEPLLVLNLESDLNGGIDSILNKLGVFFDDYGIKLA